MTNNEALNTGTELVIQNRVRPKEKKVNAKSQTPKDVLKAKAAQAKRQKTAHNAAVRKDPVRKGASSAAGWIQL